LSASRRRSPLGSIIPIVEIIPASTGQMLRQPCAEIWHRSCQLQFSFARLDRVAFREERLRKRRMAAGESKKVI
jgi:hypothetical protein